MDAGHGAALPGLLARRLHGSLARFVEGVPGMTGRELAGRAALVTGSARNIGRAIALDLARAGAAVMVNARTSRADAEAVAASIRAEGGRAEVVLADVSTPQGAAAAVGATAAAFGGLDLLVNNASVRREIAFAD